MNSTPVPEVHHAAPDPALGEAIELARAAAQQEAGDQVGDHVGMRVEDEAAVTHLFDARTPGYRGWCWAATVASAGPGTEVTVSEVVLLPGPDALVAPEWVPWQHRVQAGDLGVGDLLPTSPDDPRLVPAYLESDDEAIEQTALELGLGRSRVMARPARLDAAQRWQGGEFGPRSDMARSAPGRCGTCGFYLPIAGSLRVAFGVCGNEIAPADGHLVHAEYGCGAHSEAEVEQVSPVLVADLIYDDNALLDLDLLPRATPPEPEAEPTPEATVATEPAPVTEPAPEAELAPDAELAPEPTPDAELAPAVELAPEPGPATAPAQATAPEPAREVELAEAAEPGGRTRRAERRTRLPERRTRLPEGRTRLPERRTRLPERRTQLPGDSAE